MMERVCKICTKEKNLNEFHKRKEGLYGYRHECKLCFKTRQLKFSRTELGLSGNIFRDQKKDSKHRGHIPPSYSLKEFREWLFNQKNFKILFNKWIKSNYKKDQRPSVDRLDNYKGYSFNNIQLITWKENNEKNYHGRRLIKRESLKIIHNGEQITLTDYCKINNLNYSTISWRINSQGWSFEKAVSTPIKKLINDKS